MVLYTEDRFYSEITLDISKDTCQFCHEGHLAGLKLNKKLLNVVSKVTRDVLEDFNEESSDDYSEDDEQVSKTKKTKNDKKSPSTFAKDETGVWVSLHSLCRNKRQFAHHYCAIFSPLVWYNGKKWRNVSKEINRGQKFHCVECKRSGATIGCFVTKCKNIYHVSCAIDVGFTPKQLLTCDKFWCPSHQNNKKPMISESPSSEHYFDVSFGREIKPILVSESEIESHKNLPEFRYIKNNVDSDEVYTGIQHFDDIQRCFCVNNCTSSCPCQQDSDSNGSRLECNEFCHCNMKLCKNRVVASGIVCNLKLQRRTESLPQPNFALTEKASSLGSYDDDDDMVIEIPIPSKEPIWDVVTLQPINKGAFVCEIVGQYRETNQLLRELGQPTVQQKFDLNNHSLIVHSSTIPTSLLDSKYCLDCREYGNISRYLLLNKHNKKAMKPNNSMESNLVCHPVFSRRSITRGKVEDTPRIALFASKNIPANSTLHL